MVRKNPQHALERRRGDLGRVSDAGVKVHRVSGRVLTTGYGESVLTVPFPVTFTEIPLFTFGAELDAGSSALSQGEFPTVSAMVIDWVKIERLPFVFYYRGARLAVVTTGPALVPASIWIHWSMEGKAFRNPLDYSGTADDVI